MCRMQKEFWGTPKWIAFGWFFVPLFSVLFSFFCLLLFEFPSPFRCLPFQQFLNTHVVVLRRRYSKKRSRVFLNVFFSSFFKVAVWKNERDVEHSPVFFSPSTTFLYQLSSLFGVFVCAVFFFSKIHTLHRKKKKVAREAESCSSFCTTSFLPLRWLKLICLKHNKAGHGVTELFLFDGIICLNFLR